jgi:hypothetical protein
MPPKPNTTTQTPPAETAPDHRRVIVATIIGRIDHRSLHELLVGICCVTWIGSEARVNGRVGIMDAVGAGRVWSNFVAAHDEVVHKVAGLRVIGIR